MSQNIVNVVKITVQVLLELKEIKNKPIEFKNDYGIPEKFYIQKKQL